VDEAMKIFQAFHLQARLHVWLEQGEALGISALAPVKVNIRIASGNTGVGVVREGFAPGEIRRAPNCLRNCTLRCAQLQALDKRRDWRSTSSATWVRSIDTCGIWSY